MNEMYILKKVIIECMQRARKTAGPQHCLLLYQLEFEQELSDAGIDWEEKLLQHHNSRDFFMEGFDAAPLPYYLIEDQIAVFMFPNPDCVGSDIIGKQITRAGLTKSIIVFDLSDDGRNYDGELKYSVLESPGVTLVKRNEGAA